jgi:hypothetical protein
MLLLYVTHSHKRIAELNVQIERIFDIKEKIFYSFRLDFKN